MDSRKNKRFILSGKIEDAASIIFIEFDLDKTESIKAGIFDISLGGLAAEISSLTEEQISKIEALDDFFIRLHCKQIKFLIGVEPVWRIFKKQGRSTLFKGGFKFDLISEEDRLKLADLIEDLRSSEFLV
jgi:hypothetical protein